MKFRIAAASDAERLSELAYRSKQHWGYSQEFMDTVRPELEITAELILQGHCEIAEIEGQAAGFILLLPAAEHVELESLFVAPNSISTGIGAALVQRALVWARAQGFENVETTADPNAGGFYEKQGFVKIGEIASSTIPGRTLPRMRLALDAV